MERIPADALESLDFELLGEDKPKYIQRIVCYATGTETIRTNKQFNILNYIRQLYEKRGKQRKSESIQDIDFLSDSRTLTLDN